MITKEERAEVRKAICENREALQISLVGSWLKQYEDTVTELEGQLEQADELLHELLYDYTDRAAIVDSRLIKRIYAQLEKGDKDNANKKTTIRT